MQAKHIAKALSGGNALAFRWLEDGGMRVLCRDGRKLTFTAFQVRQAVDKSPESGDKVPALEDYCAQNVDKTPGTSPGVGITPPAGVGETCSAEDKVPSSGGKVLSSGGKVPSPGSKVPSFGGKVPSFGGNPAPRVRGRQRRQP